MKKILITGGPVHDFLDDVKIITNRFRGGLMVALAEDLLKLGAKVTYLCAPTAGASLPKNHDRLVIVAHGGIDDYMRAVKTIAPHVDGVVLGAAVANLIPAHRIVGKFPSHNYKPGDTIPIDFKIAPRIIDEVKKVAPKTHLFGYKLLSHVEHEELMRAAYSIVLEAKATAVIANDAKDLQQKFVVTKERGVHPMKQDDLASWIWEMLHDHYYSTAKVVMNADTHFALDRARSDLRYLIQKYSGRFIRVENDLIFGTVAKRLRNGFVTTGRGKRELESFAEVLKVDHERKVVFVADAKASLNAPLLGRIFDNPRVDHIVHYHEQVPGLPTYDYAPPGTVRDTIRPTHTSFNIAEHGCVLLFDKNGKRL